MRIQSRVKHLRWRFLPKYLLNFCFLPLTIFAKTPLYTKCSSVSKISGSGFISKERFEKNTAYTRPIQRCLDQKIRPIQRCLDQKIRPIQRCLDQKIRPILRCVDQKIRLIQRCLDQKIRSIQRCLDEKRHKSLDNKKLIDFIMIY